MTFSKIFTRKKRGYYLTNEPVVIILMFFIAFIAILSPINVLDTYPIIRSVTEMAGDVFPAMKAYASKSDFPQVTLLYMTVCWLTSPLHGYYLLREFRNNDSDWVIAFKDPDRWILKERVKGFIVIPVLFSIAISSVFFSFGNDFNILPINSSRFALAAFGWLFQGAGSVIVFTAAIIQIIQLVELYKKNN